MRSMILCGTDLSVAGEAVLQAAAALARKRDEELLLATVLETGASAESVVEERLAKDAAKLRQAFDIRVQTRVVRGAPERVLLALADEHAASLIVVGAEGGSKRSRRLGSVAESLCQSARIPVFVVRKAEALVSWAAGQQPLQVLLASGVGETSRYALSAIAEWPDLKLTIAHVAWPYGEHYRLGISGPMPLDELRPEVHRQLLGELERWAKQVPMRSPVQFSVTPGFGRVDSHLAQLAREQAADLLVVGTHQRNLAARLWHGSVSRNVIQEASCNILCVPQRALVPRSVTPPSVIVVPTDFSALADRAVPVAYSLLANGGRVHLVYVAGPEEEGARESLEANLRARVPHSAQGIQSEIEVLRGDSAWEPIWQFAERVGADLICMGTHSRRPASRAVLGSQAQTLLQRSRIPVVLVPPDREV